VDAAGGIVVRRGSDGRTEVAVVHRPKYSDWTLPKGKLEAGESFEQAAAREVREETGLACAVERQAGDVRYTDRHGRPKRVRYWFMRPLDEAAEFVPNEEVDELRWVAPGAAAELLSYARDRELVEQVAGS
jgi:8-oxo-dGTP diphosphatase